MTLPASGFIRISQVNTELSLGSSTRTSLSSSQVRSLAGRPSGRVSLSDLRGKSSSIVFTMVAGTAPNPDHKGFSIYGSYVYGSLSPTVVGTMQPGFIDTHNFAGGSGFAFELLGLLPQSAFNSVTVLGRTFYASSPGFFMQIPAQDGNPDRSSWAWFDIDFAFVHGQSYTITVA